MGSTEWSAFHCTATQTCLSHVTSNVFMAGYLHIIRLSTRTGTHDITFTDYQVNYIDAGINYAVAWEEERLVEFLRDRVCLDETETTEVLDELNTTGRSTIGDVDLPGSEATMLGMEMIVDETD